MKYYIIAGEASGDLHASNLMAALKGCDQNADFRCWGGDLMQNAGGEIVKHYRDLAFMGFSEVILHLGTIFGNLRFCKRDILKYNPDVVILVDYPGFNLIIAEFAHKAGFKVVYYISPQVWAWKKSRVKKIRKYVDKMLVILPFEKDFYAGCGYPVEFVGNPLLDALNMSTEYTDREDFVARNGLSGKPIVAILPGSRKQEIHRMLPVMVSMASRHPDYEFVIAGAPSMDLGYIRKLAGQDPPMILHNHTYELLTYSHAALVTSGTATLETALYRVPQVVCYKSSAMSYYIAKQLVDIKFISLVNLIMDRQVVKELIQFDFNEDNLNHELELILNENWRQVILAGYDELVGRLGGKGASKRAAGIIIGSVERTVSDNQKAGI
jgi:lipid-A-disaccharide synthase